MTSAWSDRGHPPKKKTVGYGKAASKPRAHPATLPSSSQTTSESSQAVVKDIYDFDFEDDPPPPVLKPAARPKPSSTAKASAKPPTASRSTTFAVPSNTPRNAPSTQRSTACPTTQPAHGIKRKPSQIDASDNSKKTRNGSNASAAGRANPTATASPMRQRAPRTPPRDTAVPKASVGTRKLPTSPSKARAAPVNHRTQQQSLQPSLGMPLRPQGGGQATQSQPTQSRPVPQTPKPQSSQPAQRKRRRLIDTLAAQKEESSSEEEEESTDAKDADGGDDEVSSLASTITSRRYNRRNTPTSDGRGTIMEVESLMTLSPGRASIAPPTPGTISRRPIARRPNIKFTYNLDRTMLAEQPPALDGPSGSDLSVLQSLLPEPEPKPSAFDFDEDAGGSSQGAIQSIHELRQAGANSRFADELVDIMDRIGPFRAGKPSSTRRSALMELAEKLQDKSFMRHFRDHGAESQLFRDVGKETDPISGFVYGCIVTTLLANASLSNHLLRDLRAQKIDSLFGILLDLDKDIGALARDRASNMSVFSRQVLGKLKEAMRKLPVWKPAPAAPSELSPQTTALVALHLFVQQTYGNVGGFGDDDAILSASLTKQLFAIVSSALEDEGEDEDEDELSQSLLTTGITSDAESVNLYLALSLLERHSVAAMQSDIGAEWTRHYIPIIADALDVSLKEHQKRDVQLNGLELLTLKLAMNTANNNPEAARHYVDKGLLSKLAELSNKALAVIVQHVKAGDDVTPGALDELLLMLGVMINFSENDESAAETLVAEGDGWLLIERLGKAFLDGRSIAAEADSEEKTQINVAFAYLSILLGYLCRHDPVYQVFRKLSPNDSPKPLLDSIHQFIDFHDQVEKKNTEYGAEPSNFSARLQALARELEVRAY